MTLPTTAFAEKVEGKYKDNKEAENLTQEYVVDFKYGDYPNAVDFGMSTSQNTNNLQASGYSSLATGETNVSYNDVDRRVSSAGDTEGKGLTVVTSATTSLWYSGVLKSQGSKGVGLGYWDATSNCSSYAYGYSGTWTGITVHTASDGFDIWDANTADSVYAY
jgi:hypothetical protein